MSTPETESLQIYESEEGQSSDESNGDVVDGTTETGGSQGEATTNNS